MKPSYVVRCADLPCSDVNKAAHSVPGVEIDPASIRAVMISEAASPDPSDNYYSPGDPLFQRTTLEAFEDAGLKVSSIAELVNRGFYFTTAVKCGKVGYGVGTETIKKCSVLLERELDAFHNIKVILLMGDVAIKTLNEIAKRRGGKRVIPAGSTYKIRGTPYHWGKVRVIPSYLQAGPSFFIEKSKRRMIAEDIATALRITNPR